MKPEEREQGKSILEEWKNAPPKDRARKRMEAEQWAADHLEDMLAEIDEQEIRRHNTHHRAWELVETIRGEPMVYGPEEDPVIETVLEPVLALHLAQSTLNEIKAILPWRPGADDMSVLERVTELVLEHRSRMVAE